MEDNRLVTQKNSSFLALSVVSCSPILVSKQENVVNFVTNDTDSSKWKEEKPTSKNDDGQTKTSFMSPNTLSNLS